VFKKWVMLVIEKCSMKTLLKNLTLLIISFNTCIIALGHARSLMYFFGIIHT